MATTPTIQMPTNASNTTDYTDVSFPLGDRKWFIIFKYSMYCIIFLISLIGNTIVCIVVCRRSGEKTVTNYFIMNLAMSDLLYTLCIPFDVFATVNKAWPHGAIMCRILYPAQTMTITVSGFSLTALSVTRFWAVVKPLRGELSLKQTGLVIAVLWVLATSTVIPYIIFLKYTTSEKTCDEDWPSHTQRKIYTASLLVIQYALPLTIIIVCYLMIGTELTKGRTEIRDRIRVEENRRVVKMLVIVTLVFAILTLPSTIMWMWLDFGQADLNFPHFWDVVQVLNILDFLNCASNPIIYSFCNESFSHEFRRQFMGCILRGSSPSTSTTTAQVVPSSPGNGHDIPLRASLPEHDLETSDSETTRERATLL